MKYLIFLSFFCYAFSMQQNFVQVNLRTYFGEYFLCSLFDKCSEEYQTCLADTVCSYQMFTSPCVDQCGVDYDKFFQQMRSYEETHIDSENIALFPQASCNFTTCQTNWINSQTNTVLKALKQCELQNCLQTYPSYTFIAHEYTELSSCNLQIAACESDATCKQIVSGIRACMEQSGFKVDPRTNPQQYFYEHVNSFDNPVLQCLDKVTSSNPLYLDLYQCIKPIWSQ